MSDGPPTADTAVSTFLDYLALACIFGFVDELLAGKYVFGGVALAIALVFHIVGIKWSSIRSRVWLNWIEQIAIKYRRSAITVLVGGFVLYALLSVRTLRTDLNRYAMPRVVTKEQADDLRKALLASPSETPVKVFTNVTDPEALEYGGQVFNAISAGGWEVQFQPIDPWDTTAPTIQGTRFDKLFVQRSQGLNIEVCLVGQPTNPDPKHPAPEVLLQTALREAHIEVNGGGTAADCGQYTLALVIGKRPRTIGEEPPVLVRFGDWLRRVGE